MNLYHAAFLAFVFLIVEINAVEAQGTAGDVNVRAYAQTTGEATDQITGAGTFDVHRSVAINVASASGHAQGGVGILTGSGRAHAVAGLQYPNGYNTNAQTFLTLSRQVCIVPNDPNLLGSPVAVTFGVSSYVGNVEVRYTQDPYAACETVVAAINCAYTINGAHAGGYLRRHGYGTQSTPAGTCGVYDDDYLQAYAGGNVVVTLGVPFNVELEGGIIVGTNISAGCPCGPGGAVVANSGSATAQADFVLGYPAVGLTSNGAPVAYSWVDCGASGATVDANPSIVPDLGEAFCFGDGVSGATQCPCGNASQYGAGRGCLNSQAIGGQLSAQGVASLSNDTALLMTSDTPGPTLFFQGTDAVGGGAGIVFGDGLRCVGGTTTRLGVVQPLANTAEYPSGPSPIPIHVRGGPIALGDVRHYQCWYRNAATFCTSATFNLTNALTVTWGQ